jgi:carbonic anhydrase/acetyltransferase-like protein (isoleucine patch superfamily)
MGGCYAIDGVSPVVHPTAFVHPDAVLIGDVDVAAECYIGPHASLRADFGSIRIHRGANVQDGCVLHCFPARACVVEQDGHIGHAAVLHGCTIGTGALVGIGAIIMDGARVGARAFVGAGSYVPSDMQIEDGWLVVGSPARPVRQLTTDEVAWKANGTALYQQLAERSRGSMTRVEPLTEPTAGGPRLPVSADVARPLREHRAATNAGAD